jgi:lipopolysaccharide/colanic/teichoic acid biosynthesis glycosyltransferase
MNRDTDRQHEIDRLLGRLARKPLAGAPLNAQRARVIARAVLAKRLRRGLDIAVAGCALVVLAPLMGLVALLIWATDGGPALYWQTRVGRYGETFRFPKFRSMVVDAEARQPSLSAANVHGAGITFKLRADPRVTWIGRIIRKTSIDELPQLWSVLRGDMALVGPRPALPREVARYTVADRRRLEATPGITCIWQISGRSNLPFPRQLAMDLEYIERQSLGLDLKLLLKTVPAVLGGRGAY